LILDICKTKVLGMC